VKILILSSAPSVLEAYKSLDYTPDVTVGISSTNWFIQCDYAAFIDSIALEGMIKRKMYPKKGYVYTTKFRSKKEVHVFPKIDNIPIRLTLPATYAWVIERFGVLPDIIGNERTSGPNIGGLTAGHSKKRWNIEDELMTKLKENYESRRND
jgi:hypothetical protein